MRTLKAIVFVFVVALLMVFSTPVNAAGAPASGNDALGDPAVASACNAYGWDFGFYDSNYTPLLCFSRTGRVLTGQAILAGSASFPAPIVGHFISNGSRIGIFTISYRADTGVRGYRVDFGTMQGTTWGIFNSDATYYDPPHGASFTQALVPPEDTGAAPARNEAAEPAGAWNVCFQDTNYTPQLCMNNEGGVLRGQAILSGSASFPAPITGYVEAGGETDTGVFSITYLGDTGVRGYKVDLVAKTGTTWGIFNSDSTFYDAPHGATLVNVFAPPIDLPSGTSH